LTKILFFSICVFSIFTGHRSFAYQIDPNKDIETLIRVRVMAQQSRLLIEGFNLKINPTNQFLPVALPKSSAGIVTVENRGLNIQQSGQSRLFKENLVRIKGENLRINGQSKPNDLLLSKTKSGKIDVIAVMPLEKYLIGVLAGEVPLSWPMETLKAQAVVARSYALALMRERAQQKFHVENTFMDQVFKMGPLNPRSQARAEEAVEATRGVVLTEKRRKIVKTFFHADCGGETVSADQVWGGNSPTVTVTDQSCENRKSSHWRFQISESDLKKKLGLPREVSLDSLKILRSPKNGRVTEIRIPERQGSRLLTGNQFRSLLGFSTIRSTRFQLIRTANEFQFLGQGYGHGVGLCQNGARSLGAQGKSYLEILKHYYPTASLAAWSHIENDFRTAQKL
jgi:stage II sporulation protein D